MVSNRDMTTPTYTEYTTYAQRIGVTPYTPKQWETMAPTQKMLIGLAMKQAA